MHRFAELTIIGLLHLAPLSTPAPSAPIAPLGLHTYKPIAPVAFTQPPQAPSKLNTVYVPPPPPPPSPVMSTYSGTGDYYLDKIVNFESSGNPYAVNPIGACGLFQALPCSKMGCSLSDIQCQISWGRSYVISAYGSSAAAWQHELSYHWY